MTKFANVLSIDWDFFIDATTFERAMLFPDNNTETIPQEIQDICWANRYTNPKLIGITIDHLAIHTISRLFGSNTFNPIKIYVMDSHKYCYDFVKTILNAGISIKHLINIDYHHDCYYYSPYSIHCGNWLYKLILEHPEIHYRWIKRLDDLENDELTPCIELDLSTDLNEIFKFDWNFVFICKSSVWSPPHLDCDFSNLVNRAIKDHNSFIEQDVLNSRYTDTMKYMAIIESNILKKFSNDMKGVL